MLFGRVGYIWVNLAMQSELATLESWYEKILVCTNANAWSLLDYFGDFGDTSCRCVATLVAINSSSLFTAGGPNGSGGVTFVM